MCTTFCRISYFINNSLGINLSCQLFLLVNGDERFEVPTNETFYWHCLATKKNWLLKKNLPQVDSVALFSQKKHLN